MRVEEALRELDRASLRRTMRVIEAAEGPFVHVDGRRLLCFCSNDYLGLSEHPELSLTFEGRAGAGASRLLSGTFRDHARLEERIAAFKGLPAALVYPNAYMANLGVVPVLADRETLVLSDRYNHASLIDAIRLSRARVEIFPHADAQAVEEILRNTRGRRLLVTESVFSMEGDRAPLDEYERLAGRYGAEILVDDAHGFGLHGPRGRGTDPRFPVQTGNFSKAAGAYGGFVACGTDLRDLLVSVSRTFLYTTALPPALCRLAERALELLAAAEDRRARLRMLCDRFRDRARRSGLPLRAEGPIFPLTVGSAERALAAAGALFEKGFFVPAIRPPTVPEGASRLRVSLTALHEPAHVDGLVDALARVL